MDITLYDIKFNCPHCGHINEYKHHTVKSYNSTELVYCSEEDGGCGTQIVLHTELQVKSKIKGLKISGIKPSKELENKK